MTSIHLGENAQKVLNAKSALDLSRSLLTELVLRDKSLSSSDIASLARIVRRQEEEYAVLISMATTGEF